MGGPFRYSTKKATRELSWTAIIIVVMSLGQTGLISIPSIASSLQSGVQGYANAAATYVLVSNNRNPATLNQRIPQGLLSQISSIPGVQAVYPIVTNYTIFTNPPLSTVLGSGNNTFTVHVAAVGVLSAVIGGNKGYPQQLLDLVKGMAPNGDEAGFVANTNVGIPYNISDTAQVQIAKVNFTAKEVGINKYIPLLGNNLGVLWNSTFVRNLLGANLYEKTFGIGANFVIVKVQTVQEVADTIAPIKSLFSNYPEYFVSYDEATVDNLSSLQTGLAPLYNLLGFVSIVFAVIAVLSVSYVAVSRRAWEAGLFLSQAWDWKDVRSYFFYYFLILSMISLALSILSSYAISKYTGTTYEVYGGHLQIAVAPQLEYVIAGGVAGIALPAVAAVFIIWRIRRIGLDKILREF